MDEPSPIRPTDHEARALARSLITTARFAALAVLTPGSGAPAVTRIALGLDAAGLPLTLISSLSAHTKALQASPRAGLLVGEPGPKGDPLTHPRLSLDTLAEFVDRTSPDHAALRTLWLASHPKSKLYIDFADFSFVRLRPLGAALNGGFGRAFVLAPEDLA
ncbi:pyridoxamine 5-phosphate oxidase [Frigidibacter albus]|uniref:Pyridoxamine 5-phosphate oxidase n=1 Tax=Frigidibacter albus TaxID=1465486 RepID=A0A6L8VGH8_9RHOB|nr:pyridoxamine 5'-phosphate oxidase family protein [Frigidibacter albus]MZQ89415.1 pyridoxamine 5-phosphate oxidase [Frigidibacter albus]NBE31321.1 pyridoxamine 5-phosphate oxidase [Frigidibacter albus]GGH54044.1 pyridoxamine 5'-phosphate oxidase [Frigidibacter albus]